MARNLLAEAQVTAAAQVAPQQAALQSALAQAIADRNSAIHAAATAYHGISGAIHRAGPQVRQVYSGAAKSAAATDAVAKQTIGGLASSPGVDTVRAAMAHESDVGGTVLAKSLASRLADLSNKRIAAAAGRAFQVSKANSDYSAAAATNAMKQQQVAQQEGLLVGSNYSKLREAAAGRENQRLMQQRSLQSQANLQSQRLTNEANLTAERLTSQENIAGARLRSSQHTAALSRRQQKLGRQNQRYLQDQRLKAATAPGGLSKEQAKAIAPVTDPLDNLTAHILTLKGRTDPHSIRKGILSDTKNAPPVALLNAAMDLAYKGYLSPPNQKVVGDQLRAHGVDGIPKRYLPVQVKPHFRKPRSK